MKFRSFKHCLIDLFKNKLSKLDISNYQNYNDINKTDNDFIQKIKGITIKVAPIKESWISVIQSDISYKKWFLIKRGFFENKSTEYIGKPKDLKKALKSLGLPNKVFSCEVKASKINNTVEHDVNSVLEVFKSCYSTMADNLVKLLLKPSDKYSINTY